MSDTMVVSDIEEKISSTEDDTTSSSIRESYRLNDSDSDEEEEIDENYEYSQSRDLMALKEQTKDLLDEKWKIDRNDHLLNKMLELEEPTISAKMVDFLILPGVCEKLTEFITQVGDRPRPHPHESNSKELQYSYRATMLLSVDEPSDALLLLLGKKARAIAACMFDIFRDDSAGSFYHAARILESLLRVYPGEVYYGLISDDKLEERMNSILRHIGYPPVGDLLVILVALTPVPRTSPMYTSCNKSRYLFFEALSKWKFFERIASVVVDPASVCRVDEYITAEQHCAAAAQTFNELVEKLSSEEIAEELLRPAGQSTELLKGFVDRATGMHNGDKIEADLLLASNDQSLYLTSRQASLRMLSFLLKKSSIPQNSCFVMGAQGQPVQTFVPNRLYPIRPLLVSYLSTRVCDIEVVVVEGRGITSNDNKEDEGLVETVHPGHVCKIPFSSYRAQLVEFFALLVEASASQESEDVINFCEIVSVELWKRLIFWVFEYAHNNIYHNLFYRIIFAVLRQNNEVCLRNIFKNCRIVTYLTDAFQPFDDACDDESDESNEVFIGEKNSEYYVKVTLRDRNALRGILINLCNAIRLQVSSLPPTSFLRNYLHSHSRWNEFLPVLRRDTMVQQPPGLGRYVPTPESKNATASYVAALISNYKKDDSRGLDHGSDYAKFLGFEEEIEWPEDNLEPKKKRKNKKKKKKKNRRRGKSDVSDDDQEGSGSECHSDDETDDSDTDRRASISTDGSYSDDDAENSFNESETHSSDVEEQAQEEIPETIEGTTSNDSDRMEENSEDMDNEGNNSEENRSECSQGNNNKTEDDDCDEK